VPNTSSFSNGMTEQATITVASARELRTESLRLTAFLAPSASIDQPSWWADLVGSQPDAKASRPGRGELQESGALGERNLFLSVSPGRVDWFLTARVDQGALSEHRWAGRFEEAVGVFSDLMNRWLGDCPALVRLALGAIAHEVMPDRVTAYRNLAQYLPMVRLDPEHSEDFLYQINRPRNSSIIEGLKINRLSRWSAAAFVPVRIEIAKQQLVQRPLGVGEHSCRIELDINTDPAFPGELPRLQLSRLFEELKDISLELVSRGDVP